LEQYEKAVGTPEANKIKDKLKKDIHLPRILFD